MYHGFRGMFSNMLILWMIPLVALLLIGISIYKIRQNSNKNKNSALDILDQRFANGEIEEEEYKIKKQHLKNFK